MRWGTIRKAGLVPPCSIMAAMKRRLVFLAMAVLGAALPVLANISYTCDASIDATQAGTCAALNGSTVSGVYSGVFSNANANIYITYGALGAFAESDTGLTAVSYSEYYSHLAASTDDATALASLSPTSDPLLPYGSCQRRYRRYSYACIRARPGQEAETAGNPMVLAASSASTRTATAASLRSPLRSVRSRLLPLSPSDPPVSGGIDFSTSWNTRRMRFFGNYLLHRNK